MALFQEVDLSTFSGGKITAVEPRSVASEIGLQPGDELIGINDQAVQDIIDVQYYGAEEVLDLLVRRQGELLLFEAERAYGQELGIRFAHPTFDTDIRRCNNLCEFCFVLQMAPRFRRTLYIKDDDYRYSFLFGHYVTLTNLSEHDWWRIETMKLSPLYVSVHVTDLEQRRRYLRNESAEDIVEQLQRLVSHGIEVHTQLVIVPEVNDGAWLAKSIADLAALWPGVRSISIVPVGLTSYHKYGLRPHTKKEAVAILDYIESLQPSFQEQFGIRFVYATDEWYLVSGRLPPPIEAYDGQELHENGLGMVRNFLNRWQAEEVEIRQWMTQQNSGALVELWPYQEITLVTATLFEETLRNVADEFATITGSPIDVQAVVNRRLGETITVAGLLMGRDVVDHLQANGHGDLIILPRVMFDHPDVIALDDLSPQAIADQVGRPVALADTMGDVWDALTGVSQVFYEPLEEA